MPLAYLLAILTIVSCLGYGLGLGRLVGVSDNIGDAGILGLLCLAILGCIIHFFSPLAFLAQICALGLGMALAAVFGRDLIVFCKRNQVAIFVGLSAFLHRQALTFYDTGLYHLQTFMWNSQFPITPGLANLHGRLAFNSTLFLIAPLDDRAGVGWISNLVALAFVLMSCYARLALVALHSIEYWFITLSIMMLALWPQGFLWVGVLNGDGFAAVLVIYWFSILISSSAGSQADGGLLLLTAAFAATVKLSAAPLIILAIVIIWLRRKSADVHVFAAMGVAGLLIALWMVRGLLVSGCSVYPLPQSCINSLPWAVSRTQAAYEFLGIKSWARAPHRLDYDNVMRNWTWVGDWTVRTLQDWSVRLLLFGGMAGSLAVLLGVRISRLVASVAGALGFCLAYWFFSAPDVRFGSGYLASAGILGLSVACAAYFATFHSGDFVHRLMLEAIVVSMLIGAAGLQKFGNSWNIKDPPTFRMMTAPGGKPIWVPQVVDQCWDHQLPCTPYFNAEALQRVRWR
jgi:hypothetical protein